MIGINAEFLLAYVLGGLTFLPACLLFFVLCTNKILSTHSVGLPEEPPISDLSQQNESDAESGASQKGDENLLKQFHGNHEPDVAAGYFAVCREYVPGGVNGKPPERVTPAGMVVTSDSPSVYQSMYRSIFDRKQSPGIDASKSDGKAVRRARNVFYVVLRHGHLMLYEDSEQLEVKHVISLESYEVNIYGGGARIPEGELWIKRNAIQLCKTSSARESETKPFYLFSENCSEKEDFYFALLRNQETDHDVLRKPPRSLQHDPQHIIGLVQKLHSSEDQLHTRWINGLIGRLFLALYKTGAVQDILREKITKKIARVQKPAFLSGIVLQKINVGDSAPQITNPRLKDLTIDGDCCVEADIQYNGHFRLEIAATARIDLGTRFKVREVNIVLAVVVKKLTGHGLLKFKPPPSNRVWIAFERMPDMELVIEPIVSSRQITFGMILRAIQSRIREVVAETIVVPHWDDIPFTDTAGQDFRGGIWTDLGNKKGDTQVQVTIPDEAPSSNARDDIDSPYVLSATTQDTSDSGKRDMILSGTLDRESSSEQLDNLNGFSMPQQFSAAHVDRSESGSAAPIALATSAPYHRKGFEASESYAGPNDETSKSSDPVLLIDATTPSTGDVESTKLGSSPGSHNDVVGAAALGSRNLAEGAATVSSLSSSTGTPTKRHSYAQNAEASTSRALDGIQPDPSNKSMAAIGAATAVAKKWGWGVLNRNSERNKGVSGHKPVQVGSPTHPIGRGQPIPHEDPRTPLSAAQRSSSMPLSVPKRRPQSVQQSDHDPHRLSSTTQFSGRRKSAAAKDSIQDDERLLVVQAPAEDMNATALQPSGPQRSLESYTAPSEDIEHDPGVDMSEHQIPAGVHSLRQQQFGNT